MDRRTSPSHTNGVKRRSISFRFFPQGTSTTPFTHDAGTLRDPGRHVNNVTRTATAGVFTVTMNERAHRVIGIQATAQLAANNVDLVAQAGSVSNEGTGNPLAFNVRLMAGGTATDMSANANNSVSVTVEIEDSAAAGVA